LPAQTRYSPVASQHTCNIEVSAGYWPQPRARRGSYPEDSQENVMQSVVEFRQRIRSTVCLLLSVVIVTAGLSLGAVGTQLPLHRALSAMAAQ
jgi:hypothetical protein